MNPLRTFIAILALIAVTAPLPVRAAELKPHNVIVRSTFKEKIKVPKIKNHVFNPLVPHQIRDPYLPDFYFDVENAPEDFPQNQQFNWLTAFSPSLSRMFRGNDGKLENGIQFYQHGKLDESEADLHPLLTEAERYSQQATLYLAWIKYRENLWDESVRLTKKLTKITTPEVLREAIYLRSLIYLRQQKYEDIVNLYSAEASRIDNGKLSPKQSYLYLIALVNLGYWKEARTIAEQTLRQPIQHSRFYYKIIELAAMVEYEQKKYVQSLERFLKARQYNGHPSYQQAMNRRIAWLQYLTGDYKAALETLKQPGSQLTTDFVNERNYLMLACFVQLKQWEPASRILNQFKQDQIFYTYGAFLIRSFLKEPASHPTLFHQVFEQKFDFPEMKFHVAILDGNLFFKNGKYEKARQSYLRALSVDSSSADYWKAQYNLALTRLRLGQHNNAEADFKLLLRTGNAQDLDRARYHLAYTQYLLEKGKETLDTINDSNMASFDEIQWVELVTIKAGSLMRTGQYNNALRFFKTVWNASRQTDAIEFIARIHYDQQQFEKVLAITAEYPKIRTDTLVQYEIKSLLALRRFENAKRIMESVKSHSKPFIELRIKVWAANQEHERIISYVSQLLRSSLTSDQRRFYYLTLGDAYFNLQKYRESKSQFFRAQNLTSDPALKSLIQYNIALSSYYYKDYTSFKKEVQQVLSGEQVSDEVRYNLTLLLAEYYQTARQLKRADTVYWKYIQAHRYNRANIHLKRIRLWHQNGNYKRCLQLSRQTVKDESDFQRRDRMILFGYCANQTRNPQEVITAIQNELKNDSSNFRNDELSFVLAQAYSQSGKYDRSMKLSRQLIKKPLNPKVRHETQLLITFNLLQVQKPDHAAIELGDVNQYRSTGQYVKSLQMRSEIEFQQKQYHKAHRTLLRIYYLPDSNSSAKQLALLRLAEGYLDEGKPDQAQEQIKRIDLDTIRQVSGGNLRYKKAANAIRKFQTQS